MSHQIIVSNFLQTKEWMEFQKSLGREVFDLQGPIKTSAVKHDGSLGKSYLYIPSGPQVDFSALTGGFDNPAKRLVGELKELATKERSIFIKAEPLEDSVAQLLVKHGFKKVNKEIHPHKTVIIDLGKDEEELLSAMHHKTRYNIRVAEKHGITVKDSDEIESFLRLLHKTSKRDNFGLHSDDYYRKLLNHFRGSTTIKTELVLAYHQDTPVAGMIVLCHGAAAYYLHGASDHQYRQLMAPYLMHWENIKFLKENGFEYYDLWGINAAKWPGVTRFKLGWGGKQVEYPGSFDLPVSKPWYLIYKAYRSLK